MISVIFRETVEEILNTVSGLLEKLGGLNKPKHTKIAEIYRSIIFILSISLASMSSVIRQKGESQNRCFKKTKHAKFSEKRTFLTP